jgi:Flp pilus assembly protein TadG
MRFILKRRHASSVKGGRPITKWQKVWLSWRRDETGAVAVITALCLGVFIMLLALVLDIGHLVGVRSELQNAADASALAGARALVPYNTAFSPQPDWVAGQTRAEETVTANQADGQTLIQSQVQTGYWSLITRTFQPTTIVPGLRDVPAVTVTITKAAGQNNGPVQMFFAQVMGIPSLDVGVRALAFISAPVGVPGGGSFPMAVPKVLVDQYWDRDPPTTFKIGSSYHDPVGGQWTSFLVDNNDVPFIRDLIDNGNPSPIKVGDNIWIQPGTKDSLFAYVQAEHKIGQTVLLPVVTTNFDTHSFTPILSFVSFYIKNAVGGSGKYIEGNFVKDRGIDYGTPGNPFNGTFIYPKLGY